MHVFENSDYYCIPDYISIKLDLLKWLVYLFMIVSGFSMCCGYYERIMKGNISLTEFYSRRYRKLLPFFCFLVIIDCIYSFSRYALLESIADITLVFSLLPNPNISIIGVGWFIGIVFLFYMLFPFFCYTIKNRKSAWLAMIISIFYNIASYCYFFDDNHVISSYKSHTNILFCSMFFYAGDIIYLYRKTIINIFKKYFRYGILLVGTITVVAVLFLYKITEIYLPFVCLFVFSTWIIYAISYDSKLLINKFTNIISNNSLEIYLSHMLLYRIFEKTKLLYLFGYGVLSLIIITILSIIGSLILSVLLKKTEKIVLREIIPN